MSNKMKCYVCYKDYLEDGCSEALAAYWYEKDAKEWLKVNHDNYIYSAKYKEMEIE